MVSTILKATEEFDSLLDWLLEWILLQAKGKKKYFPGSKLDKKKPPENHIPESFRHSLLCICITLAFSSFIKDLAPIELEKQSLQNRKTPAFT